MDRGDKVDLLRDSPRLTTSVQWPAEVDERLNLLVSLLAAEGVLISRAQLLSALVATAQLDRAKLRQMARTYLGRMQAGYLDATAPPADELPAIRHRGRQRRPPA